MDELSPRARALLEAAQGSDDPKPSDAARVRQTVLLRIGSAGFGALLFTLCVERAKALLGAALPKLFAVALLAAGSSALSQHFRASAAQAQADLPSAVALPEAPAWVPRSVPQATPDPALVAPTPEASTPKPVAAPKALPRDNLEAEMRWVRAADVALRAGNAKLALSLLNQHAREFPNGLLAEEREGLRVVAGCQSGTSPLVQRAARRFLQRAPRSLMAGRVRAACSGPAETGS